MNFHSFLFSSREEREETRMKKEEQSRLSSFFLAFLRVLRG
jgi:hypothetical protein